MSLAVVCSRALDMASAPEVRVEVHLANGLPSFSIVGLPDAEVRESRERVRAALLNCKFEFPARRITVNLAPADLPKGSGRFDLPIALGILAANAQLPARALAHREFAGELSLSGELRGIRGAFAMAVGLARQARAEGRRAELILPSRDAPEAALVPGVHVFGAADLPTLVGHLTGKGGAISRCLPAAPATAAPTETPPLPDLADVTGQQGARRALEVAAAGAHHLLLCGPPGAGKSMLAQRLPGILPPLDDAQALELAALLSASPGGFAPARWRLRPFRAPHHSASAAALIGGGNPPRPGEVTLAHHGVLFLDELPEFDRRALEMLREPLETGVIGISRAARQAEFPAACQVVAAMNPCPCGWLGDPSGRCRCSPDRAAAYRRRLSGALLDRIDIRLEVAALSSAEMLARATTPAEPSDTVARRVAAARERQHQRQQVPNARLRDGDIDRYCRPDDAAVQLLRTAGDRFAWSARAFDRVLKVARTVADLAGCEVPGADHVAEAIQYRRVV